MHEPLTSPVARQPEVQNTDGTTGWRGFLRGQALENAMHKRTAGVPTYTVPEAAALLSISQEYLYRLIQAGAFPAVRMRLGTNQGRYVVPAKAIERLLKDATTDGGCVEAAEWSERWQANLTEGAA
jgi:excisionase family DNA binding protein